MAKSISRYLADISSTSGVLDGTLSTAAQTNITSLGTLSSLTVSGSAAMTLTTAAQPNITSLGTLTTLTVDDITINGSTISDAADLTIDVGGDIILDAAGSDVRFHNAGTLHGRISTDSTGVWFISDISDKDIIFRGNDGGSMTTALTLDMSAAGAATFNGTVKVNGAGNTLELNASSGVTYQKFSENGTGRFFLATLNGADGLAFVDADGSSERMRITQEGELRVGTSNDYGARLLGYEDRTDHVAIVAESNCATATQVLLVSSTRNTSSNQYTMMTCQRRGNSSVLHINDAGNVTNTNNSYGSISDQRLKTDIADASSQWDDIKALKVRKFKMGMEPDAGYRIGVISQELESAGMSGLVEEKPADEYQIAYDSSLEGEKIKEVKYSVLYMKAIKALQEAMERIEALEAK